jgi:hypothetical protein
MLTLFYAWHAPGHDRLISELGCVPARDLSGGQSRARIVASHRELDRAVDCDGPQRTGLAARGVAARLACRITGLQVLRSGDPVAGTRGAARADE